MATKSPKNAPKPEPEKEPRKTAVQEEPVKKLDMKTTASYGAKDITVLEGLEPVRKRPGMYIGSTGIDGLHHLVWEIFDNSLDEAVAGHAKHITITLLPDDTVSVVDDGRGIPTDIHPKTKKSALEVAATTLHAGGKFGGDSYKISVGLHGVGLSVVNALSSWLKAQVRREGALFAQEYKQGKPQYQVKKVGKADDTGTEITFRPDSEIFKETKFDWARIVEHLRQQAYLAPGVWIKIRDERGPASAQGSGGRGKVPNEYNYYFEGGIASYLKHLNRGKNVIQEEIFYLNKEAQDVYVEVAFQYIDDIQPTEYSFANNVYTAEGGSHLTGFRTALTRTLNDYARKNGYLKAAEENLTGDDVREGLVAIVSTKIREPQFEGQTKGKLGNPEARTAVDAVLGEKLSEWMELNTGDARKIMEKCLLAQRARKAAKAAKDTVLRKGLLDGMTLPGKLADCSTKHAEEAELFIVEGDSAGGSAKQGRDRRFQAILPLRGKILNVERARLDKMLASAEVKALVIALGTSIGEGFNLEKLRYHKIITATDADVDGAHIRTLLLTLFFRYFPKIIEGGHLFIAQPPLYKIQAGKTIHYAYSDAERDKIVKGLKDAKHDIQRYKGLGEMNAEQLRETTMDPANRTLRQVTIEDAAEANKIFDVLMGDEVLPRKNFIQTYAKEARNLDI